MSAPPARPAILYGDLSSGSATVEAALTLLGLPFEAREVDLRSNAQRGDAYAAINPQRKLPTLVLDGDELLTESVAILLTLDDRHPDAGLLPVRGSRERAQALRWLLFVATECYPMVEINDYPERFSPDKSSAPEVREIARGHWRSRWKKVEAAIAGDPWLLSWGFCITDVYIAVVSRWAQQSRWRPDNIPKVDAIAAAVARHPVVGPVWERHFS